MEGVTLPRALSNVANGQIEDSLLSSIFPGSKYNWRLHTPVIPLFKGFFKDAEALKDGREQLSLIAGSGSAYRSYPRQYAMFFERHYRDPYGRYFFEGRRYSRRVGMAPCAIPGTSNHGWGLACDLCWISVETGAERAISNTSRIALRPIAAKYGIVDTVTSESWHWVVLNADYTTQEVPVPPIVIPPPPIAGTAHDVPFSERPWLGDKNCQTTAVAGHEISEYVDLARWEIVRGSGLKVDTGPWSLIDVAATQTIQKLFRLDPHGVVDTPTWGVLDWINAVAK